MPDVFAYCGDALFPAMILPQIVDLIDAQFTGPLGGSFSARFSALHKYVSLAFRSYPAGRRNVTILQAGREESGMASRFLVGVLGWSMGASRWQTNLIETPQTGSGLALIHGSGTLSIQRAMAKWQASPTANTSRVAFGAFVQALKSGIDPASGGPPQMVGVYRIGNGRQFGMMWNGRGYLAGLPVGRQTSESMHVEWRNEAFERVSVVTRRPLPRAKRHVDVGNM